MPLAAAAAIAAAAIAVAAIAAAAIAVAAIENNLRALRANPKKQKNNTFARFARKKSGT